MKYIGKQFNHGLTNYVKIRNKSVIIKKIIVKILNVKIKNII